MKKWLQPKKKKESSVQAKCVDYLANNYTGSFHITSCGTVEVCSRDKEGKIYATHFMRLHPEGTPDISGHIVIGGEVKPFYFEVKRSGKEKPRKNQAKFLEVSKRQGCICGFGTLDDLKHLLNDCK